jgi:pyruvate,orthophosphate dikinase
MDWADTAARLEVRTNADTPKDARVARDFGAQGIGLCRTEHMFFAADRIKAMREMILAADEAGRRKALAKLLPIQRGDFEGLFKTMDGQPVIIRLLDPPLHEFLPQEAYLQEELAAEMGLPVETIRLRVQQLHEANPMLGLRGCRLGLVYPEISEMQVRAILEAAANSAAAGVKVKPEIMFPLVATLREMEECVKLTRRVADEVAAERGAEVKYLVGTMIELPRAALRADELARHAEFFSFGTNDLTQMTYGFSRDDVGPILASYIKQGILERNPFQTVDQEGVGELMKMALERGRKTRPELEVGICGEQGGDPATIEFCHFAGLDYVSCSPYRVPIARLAAAQASIKEQRAAAPKKAKK